MNPSIFLEAPNFWTFWSFLLVKLHCSASLLHLAIFKKVHKFFEKPFYFFRTKNLSFLRFEKSYYFSCILQQTCCRGRISKKLKIFLEKPIFIPKGSQVSNVLRKLTKSVAFYSKFATFITCLKNRIFFEKTHPFVEKNTQFSEVLRNFTFLVTL